MSARSEAAAKRFFEKLAPQERWDFTHSPSHRLNGRTLFGGGSKSSDYERRISARRDAAPTRHISIERWCEVEPFRDPQTEPGFGLS